MLQKLTICRDMLRGFLYATCLLVALALPSMARAQAQPEPALSGVLNVRLTASQTTPSATACGIDLQDLLPALSEVMTDGGLEFADESPVTVTLSVITAQDESSGTCATTPMLGVYRTVSYFDDSVGWLRTGHAVLWQRGSTTITPSADHPGAAKDAVAVLARTLLTSWRADNPSTN
jgi:hypothetical protein